MPEPSTTSIAVEEAPAGGGGDPTGAGLAATTVAPGDRERSGAAGAASADPDAPRSSEPSPGAPPSGEPDPGASSRLRRWAPRLAAIVLVGLVVAPLLATARHLWGSGYHPAGDLAVLEMRVRDVGRHTPLLGPYSRYGWSHPGPLLYVLLAIPYRLVGAGASAILSASAVFNAVMIAGMGLVAWRRGRLPLVGLTTALLMIFVYWMTPTYLADPWNPFITVLPVGLFVLLAWSVVERDRWCLPACALVGSFLAQSHVGYLPVVLVVSATVAVEALGRRVLARRDAARADGDDAPPLLPHRWRRPAWLTVAVVVVVWIPVVIDQVVGTGNLREIADYFVRSDRTPYGFDRALELMAREWGNRAPWLGGPEPILAAGGAVGPREVDALRLPIAALAAGAVLAAAGRAWSALRFLAMVVLVALVTVVSVARITDVVYDYLVRWTWIVGVLIWLAALWALWAGLVGVVRQLSGWWRTRSSPTAAPPRALVLAAQGLVVAFVLAGGLVLANRAAATDERPATLPEGLAQTPLDVLIPQVRAGAPPTGTLFVASEGGSINTIGDGLALALERDGHPLAFDPDLRYKFGPRRTTEVADPAVATVTVVYADDVAAWDRRADATAIARWDPLAPDERVEFDALGRYLKGQFQAVGRDDLIAQLRANDSAAGGFDIPTIDRGALDRWEDLRRRGQIVAVYVSAPPS